MNLSSNPALLPKIRSGALMGAIQHMPCTLRIASFIPGGHCADQSTVVGCHIDRSIGKGMGTKVSDLFVAAGCFHCHNILDGRDRKGLDYITEHYPTAMVERMLKGLCETQARWVGMGLLHADGMEVI